jgi:polyhydroxybutyrate depolymerase
MSMSRRRHWRALMAGALAVTLVLSITACREPRTPPGPTTTLPPGGGNPNGGDPLGGAPAAGTQPVESRPAPSGCVTNVGPSDSLVIRNCGAGITYSVMVPPECMQFKCGLIFDIHGMTMSAASQDGGTNMRAIGKREKYIVVQPTASGGNPTGTGLQGTAWDFGAGQASPAVANFIDTAARVWRVDTRRIHVMGFSMGGSMTWWLRCRKADVLASVAPMSFSNANGGRCPNVQTPVLYSMGGATDSLSGDTSMSGGFSGTMRNVIQAYGLSNPQNVAQGAGYTWKRFTKGSFVFETIVHSYTTAVIGSHCIFGAPRPALLCSCDGTQPIKQGEVIMDFFKKHPKR